MSIFDIFKSSSKNKADKYERNNDLPAKEEVLGHSLYKRDINGLKAYLDDMPNMRNIYTEFTWAIRNDYSVEKYLIKADPEKDKTCFQPLTSSILKAETPGSLPYLPANSVTTRFVRTATNKQKCPVYQVSCVLFLSENTRYH